MARARLEVYLRMSGEYRQQGAYAIPDDLLIWESFTLMSLQWLTSWGSNRLSRDSHLSGPKKRVQGREQYLRTSTVRGSERHSNNLAPYLFEIVSLTSSP